MGGGDLRVHLNKKASRDFPFGAGKFIINAATIILFEVGEIFGVCVVICYWPHAVDYTRILLLLFIQEARARDAFHYSPYGA